MLLQERLHDIESELQKLGVAVGTVPGHEAAFKITRPVDLVFAEALLASGTLGS